MKHPASCALVVFLSMALGCQQAPPPAESSVPSASEQAAAAAVADDHDDDDDDHGHHEHSAPHGGTLVEFGDEFAHLELVLEPATRLLTVYALDGEAERPVRVTEPAIDFEITLPNGGDTFVVRLSAVENALTGERVGDSSQFTATVPALKGTSMFVGRVVDVRLRGERFTGIPFEFPGDH